MTDEKLIENFYAMWNNYPYKVRLIRSDRIVLAVNKAAADAGLKTGELCTAVGHKEAHAGCLSHLALEEKLGKHLLTADGSLLKFWIPVSGREDAFVHFSVPSAEFSPQIS